jgi:hypothetical protein
MGLYPQPNKYQCGPFALKYALIMLGKFVDENAISRIAGTHWWTGTDEIKLGRAAHAFGCDLRIIRRTKSLRAKRDLLLSLKKGSPAILCVDGWEHWITVVCAEKGKFVFIDSREAPVVCVDTWLALKKRWVYKEVDQDDPTETKTLYDLHLLIPRFRVRTKARLSLKRARYLRRPENREFATHWDEYFTDLIYICTPRDPRSEKVFPLGVLLRRHGAMIREQVSFWHGRVKKDQIRRLMRNMKFVADTYDLVVRKEDEKRAIAAITTLLTLWASSRFGVGDVYGNA